MSSGYRDGCRIIFHDLADHGSTLHHRKTEFFCADKFRIVFGNRCRVNDKVDVRSYIFGCLFIYYFYPKSFQVLCDFGCGPVGTGDRKSHRV